MLANLPPTIAVGTRTPISAFARHVGGWIGFCIWRLGRIIWSQLANGRAAIEGYVKTTIFLKQINTGTTPGYRVLVP
jgi:hypothetical protein